MNPLYILGAATAVACLTGIVYYQLSVKRKKENILLQAEILVKEVIILTLQGGSMQSLNDFFVKYQKLNVSLEPFKEVSRFFIKVRYFESASIGNIIAQVNHFIETKHNDNFILMLMGILKEPDFFDLFTGKFEVRVRELVAAKDIPGIISFERELKNSYMVKLNNLQITKEDLFKQLEEARTPTPSAEKEVFELKAV